MAEACFEDILVVHCLVSDWLIREHNLNLILYRTGTVNICMMDVKRSHFHFLLFSGLFCWVWYKDKSTLDFIYM